MSLSCSCSEYDGEISWYWMGYSHVTMPVGIRKRCCSCDNLIDVASDVIEFPRHRDTKSDIEERIYGDSLELASWFMCESCSGLYLALGELGYCLILGDAMRDLVSEHNELQKKS